MRIGFRKKYLVFVLYLRRRPSLEVWIARRWHFGYWSSPYGWPRVQAWFCDTKRHYRREITGAWIPTADGNRRFLWTERRDTW